MNPHIACDVCCPASIIARPCWPFRDRVHLYTGATDAAVFSGMVVDSTNPPAGTAGVLQLTGGGGATASTSAELGGGGAASGYTSVSLPAAAAVNIGRGGYATDPGGAVNYSFGGGARGGTNGLSFGGGRSWVTGAGTNKIAGGGGGAGNAALATLNGNTAQGGDAGCGAGAATASHAAAGDPASGGAGGAGGADGGADGSTATLIGAPGGIGFGSAGGGGGGYAGGGGGGESGAGAGLIAGMGGGGDSSGIGECFAAVDGARAFDGFSAGMHGDGELIGVAAKDGEAIWRWRRCECECGGAGIPSSMWLCLTQQQYDDLLAGAGGYIAAPGDAYCSRYIAFSYDGEPWYIEVAGEIPENTARSCTSRADTGLISSPFWTTLRDYCCVPWIATPYDEIDDCGCGKLDDIAFCDSLRATLGIPACLADDTEHCHLVEYEGMRYQITQPDDADADCPGVAVVTELEYVPLLDAVCAPQDRTPTSFLIEGQISGTANACPAGDEECLAYTIAFDITMVASGACGVYYASAGPNPPPCDVPIEPSGNCLGGITITAVAGCCTSQSETLLNLSASLSVVDCDTVEVCVHGEYSVLCECAGGTFFTSTPGLTCTLTVALPGTGHPLLRVAGLTGSSASCSWNIS